MSCILPCIQKDIIYLMISFGYTVQNNMLTPSFLTLESALPYLPCYFKVFSYFLLVHRAFGTTGCKKKSIWLLKFPKEILHDFILYVTTVYKLLLKYFLCVCFWNLLLSLLLFFINNPDISDFLTIFDCLTWLEDTWHLHFRVWMLLVGTISRHGRSKMSFQTMIPMYALKCEHSI